MRLMAMMMVTLILVGGLAFFAGSSFGSVPVPNADMEEGRGDMPDGWIAEAYEGSGAEFAWETQFAHSGRRSFRVKKIGSQGYTILRGDFIPVQEGKTYQITAWIYPLSPVKRGVYFILWPYSPGSTTPQYPLIFGDPNVPFFAGQWQQVELTVTIRKGINRIRICCIQGYEPSEVCWDDFEVTELSPPPNEALQISISLESENFVAAYAAS